MRSGRAPRPRCRTGQSGCFPRDRHAEENATAVQFENTEQTRDAVAAWITAAHLKLEQFLFPRRVSEWPHLSTRQYSRIVGS
jgi:hypothetical protein